MLNISEEVKMDDKWGFLQRNTTHPIVLVHAFQFKVQIFELSVVRFFTSLYLSIFSLLVSGFLSKYIDIWSYRSTFQIVSFYFLKRSISCPNWMFFLFCVFFLYCITLSYWSRTFIIYKWTPFGCCVASLHAIFYILCSK